MGKRVALLVGLLAIAACSDPVAPEHTTSSGNHTTSSGNLRQVNPGGIDSRETNLRESRLELPQSAPDVVRRLDDVTRVR
jgi:hypothetical protein